MYELKEKAIKTAARFLIQRGYEVVDVFARIKIDTGDADDIPYLTGSGRRIEHVFAG